jgi:LytS/YehU family sensor histidine kinase
LREEQARLSEVELLRARSELKALRAQVNPHFLFNTLHSVRALIRENPDSAEEALVELGDLLRYALRVQDAADDGVLLREEWEFSRAYLALEKLRLGDRLHVEEELSDAALQSVVPAFVLQPLVENAIRHGIAPRERGGTVWIRAELADGALRLQVRDDGPGANGFATKGMGLGLDLLRQRLRALYGAAGSVEVASAGAAGFSVTLRFPCAMESR